MALYRFPEYSITDVVSHIPTYGINIVQITSEIIADERFYIMEVTGEIPEEQLPHLIEGLALEVI